MFTKIINKLQELLISINLSEIAIVLIVTVFLLWINNISLKYSKSKVKKLKRDNFVFFLSFLSISFILFNSDNFIYILSISLFLVILNSKDYIQNIISGFLIKYFNTAIKRNSKIKFKEDQSVYKILETKLIKTYLLDIETEEVISIQNKKLFEEEFEHNVFDKMNINEFQITLKNKNLKKIVKETENILDSIIEKEKVDFTYLKDNLELIKYNYGYFPNFKPRYTIDIESDKDIKMNIKIFTYSEINKSKIILDILEVIENDQENIE